MRKYWLLDQHDGDGPTALVETDGSLHIVDIIRFGPGITSLAEQQQLWDRLIGGLAPTMKPLVEAASLDVDGEPPSSRLRRGDRQGGLRAARRDRGGAGGGGRETSRDRGGRNRSGSSGPR